ncbi:hypothetical protein BK809_0000157 [Diplodia seriata]|uniref:Heterokaryon incompatibility domain-containing protein n=1 Tax=Diplodia seriata TaxID=420778 RepID=A0A1S8B9T0_9PEZI|nr:hypothetical protein BK809_0000157 [Diplodia seriata]
MHEIYSQARRAIVWLGDPTSETDLAMQYIRNVHAPVEKGKEDQISDVVALKNWPLRFLSTAPLSLTDIASLVAFYKFLRQPWWYRAWIVQEMGLARALNMQCGKEIVTFSQVKAALQITRRIHPAFILYTDVVKRSIAEDPSLEADWPSDAINNALNLEYCRRMILERDARTASNGHPSAEQVSWSFWSTRARLCKMPHDRAFSLLGIAGKDFRKSFASRYEDAPEEHYRNTV